MIYEKKRFKWFPLFFFFFFLFIIYIFMHDFNYMRYEICKPSSTWLKALEQLDQSSYILLCARVVEYHYLHFS